MRMDEEKKADPHLHPPRALPKAAHPPPPRSGSPQKRGGPLVANRIDIEAHQVRQQACCRMHIEQRPSLDKHRAAVAGGCGAGAVGAAHGCAPIQPGFGGHSLLTTFLPAILPSCRPARTRARCRRSPRRCPRSRSSLTRSPSLGSPGRPFGVARRHPVQRVRRSIDPLHCIAPASPALAASYPAMPRCTLPVSPLCPEAPTVLHGSRRPPCTPLYTTEPTPLAVSMLPLGGAPVALNWQL